MRTRVLTSLLAAAPLFMFSQKPGELVFDDSFLHEIRIETSLPNWFDTLDRDWKLASESLWDLPVPDRLCERAFFDGVQIDSVGLRERGNFSNSNISIKRKKPFKISFDAFREEQRFDGLKSINLLNENNDPSFVRQSLAYRLMREAVSVASRASYCRFYVNDEFIGLYLIVEQVDKAFLKLHYGSQSNDNNLYKTGHISQVSLKWKGYDKEAYKKQGLELKTNETADDWSGLIQFIDIINHTGKDSLEQKISAVFDVENYLHILAVEKLIYSWDSYWGGGNNFYLYDHPDGRFRWIPWDFNETFQEFDGGLVDWLTDPSFLVPTNVFDSRPLLKAIFSVEKWRRQYLEIVCEMLESGRFGLDSLSPPAIRWHEQIAEAYREDENRLFDLEAFGRSLTENTEETVIEPTTGIGIRLKLKGVFPFIRNRVGWAHEQLGFWEFDCKKPENSPKTYGLAANPNPAHDELTLSWADAAAMPYSKIQLFDALGHIVSDGNWQPTVGQSAQTSVEGLPGGLYFLVKRDGDGRFAAAKILVD